MNYPESLFSIRTETICIGGLIKNPKSLIELDSFFSDKDFYHKVHRVIFSVLRSLVFSSSDVNKVIVAQKCKELGLSMFEDLNIFDYLDSASFTNVNEKGIKDLARELIKLRIKRELWDNASAVQNFLRESGDKSIDELIHGVDGLYNSQVLQYSTQIEPIDIYSNIESFIKEIAKNPKEEVGFKTPFSEWNKLFGGIRTKQTTNIISRAGEGKSCFLFNMAKHVCKLNGIKAIYFDTEMDVDLNMFRAGAAEMGLNAWYLETGQWTKNVELSERVMRGFDKIKQYQGSIYYIHVPSKPIQEIISMAKRWYYKNVGRGNKCAIVYDYLKITEQLSGNKMEYQALGDKLNFLNELGHELDSSILTAGQQNRSAEYNGARNDDSTTAAVSDRINHLVGFNAVFRKKTPDEISEFGTKYGSHLLKPFKTSRVQGKDNYNMNSVVKIIDNNGKAKYKQNFLNYDILDYNLTEKGTYKDIVDDQSLSRSLQKDVKPQIELP